MTSDDGTSGAGEGAIGRFARHRTAANLLMALMIVSGLFALMRMNTQFFPDFGIDVIAVTVEWPGATPEDVDLNIIQSIEPEVRFLDNVKRVRSTSYDSLASIAVEFEPGSDMQKALSEVESAVARVTTLPEDAERPEVRQVTRYDTIGRLVLSGPYPESSLKAIAKRMRDDLLDRGIDKVDIFGTREEEIWVSVSDATLRRLDLTLSEIGQRIAESSLDLPSGEVTGGAFKVRSLGLRRTAGGIEEIEIKALGDGNKIYLGDVAKVEEAFERGGKTARRAGNGAVELHVQRAINADALELSAVVDRYVADIAPTLPVNLRLEQYDRTADYIRDRVNLLLKNGAGGLLLVVAVLFIFLSARVAFWVAVGIPVSVMATMAVMLFTGQSINMLSLFGLIMVIGIVVDDAIVVGEHAQALRQRGLAPLQAAVQGARRMVAPVVSSSLTTIAAFIPLFVIGGIIGDIIEAIPLVVVAVLIASLVECFFVLPGHLRGALAESRHTTAGLYGRFRRRFDAGFAAFRNGPFRRFVQTAIAWRTVTLALALASFVLALGLVLGGRVGFNFFPTPEADKIYGNVEMVSGSSRAETLAMLEELERALDAAAERFAGPGEELVRMSVMHIGTPVGEDIELRNAAAADTVGGVVVELKPSDSRDVRTAEMIAAWREEVRPQAGLRNLTIRQVRAGPPGRDVDVRLRGADMMALKQASREVEALLDRYPGVSDVNDDLPYGAPEVILEVSPEGRAFGFTTEIVGRQVRNALEGAIAKRFPRNDEEVTVRVQYPRAEADTGVLERLALRSPQGLEVPLEAVTTRRGEIGFARIRREDGRREVAVTAELNADVTSTGEILDALERDGLAEIASRYGVTTEFAGRAEEEEETFADMRLGSMLGLVLIYIILAWVFSSYARPVVVMSVIPLAFVGAVLGHWLLGYDLTILSMIALIGLAGIVINDSIVLVTTIDNRRRELEPFDAIVEGACERLRAVILTSATTIGGLTPLLFETSLQAQFLIPMALTIVFGLLGTTVLVLVVVPAAIAVQADLARALRPSPA